MIEKYGAAGLSQTAGRIREFNIPNRPRFIQDLLRVPTPSGIYIFGAEQQRLEGKSAEWLFETIVPKLDGTRTLKEIKECFPEISDDAYSDLLYLLQMHGMLESWLDADSILEQESLGAQFASQMTFFSRYLRVTGHCRNRFDAQQKLLKACVILVGEENAKSRLAQQLSAHGIGNVIFAEMVMGETDSTRKLRIPLPYQLEPDLVICIGDYNTQVEVAQHCLTHNWPLLCLNLEGFILGPLMYPRVTACPTCLSLQRDTAQLEGMTSNSAVRQLWRQAFLSRATQRVISYITLLYQVGSSLGGIEVWQPPFGQVESQQSILRLPNCPTCGASITPLTIKFPNGHEDNMAVLFHQAVALKPWQLQQPALMQAHFDVNVIRTTRTAFRQHQRVEREALKENPALLDQPVSTALNNHQSESSTCNLTYLGTILRYSAGGRVVPLDDNNFYIERYTASGGNLGSAELYLFARRVSGLATGLYHYLLTSNILERLRELDEDAELLRNWGGNRENNHFATRDADVIIVIVSDVARVFSKYSNRGYIYCLLDAGLMAHRIGLLAQQFGLASEIIWEFDDEEVNSFLGIQFLQLAPACIVAIKGN